MVDVSFVFIFLPSKISNSLFMFYVLCLRARMCLYVFGCFVLFCVVVLHVLVFVVCLFYFMFSRFLMLFSLRVFVVSSCLCVLSVLSLCLHFLLLMLFLSGLVLL